MPAGCIDPGEEWNPVITAERELLEETGYKGKNGRIVGKVCPNPALRGNFCSTVLIDGCEKVQEQELEDTEAITVFQVSANRLEDIVKSGVINHTLMLNALYFFEIEHKWV